MLLLQVKLQEVPGHGTCAVKYRIREDAKGIADFETELNINLRIVPHENLATVVAEVRGKGTNAPLVGFAMEWYEQGSMHDVQTKSALQEFREVLDCLLQVCLPCKDCLLRECCDCLAESVVFLHCLAAETSEQLPGSRVLSMLGDAVACLTQAGLPTALT
jgi:hypothetical protein